MTRPIIDHVARAHAVLLQLDAHITLDEVRALARCADACGLSLGKWILECAQVQAAKAIDAMQATERRARCASREANSDSQVNERRRKARRDGATT